VRRTPASKRYTTYLNQSTQGEEYCISSHNNSKPFFLNANLVSTKTHCSPLF